MAYIYIMTQKIKTTDLFNADLGDNFAIAQKLRDIRDQANTFVDFADRIISEDGEHAKLYAEQVAECLKNLAWLAELGLQQMIEVNGKPQSNGIQILLKDLPESKEVKYETCDICAEPDDSVVTFQLGEYGHESICEDCREDLLEKL